MLTHIHLNAHVVWDDVLWQVIAIYQDSADAEPVTLERAGRAPLDGEDSPYGVLAAAVRALERDRVQQSPPHVGD